MVLNTLELISSQILQLPWSSSSSDHFKGAAAVQVINTSTVLQMGMHSLAAYTVAVQTIK